MGKWEMVRLSDIIDEAITGEWGTECADDEVGTKILRTTNFTNLGVINFDNVVVRSIPASKVKKKRLKRNDIILEKSGGSDNQPVGRVVFFEHGPDEVFLCNNFTQALRIKSRVAFPRYVFLYLLRLHQNGATELLQNKTTGIRNLQVKQYMALEIPLPPPDIQRQIAGLLDRASVLIEKRKAQIDKLDLLVKSQFIEMFGDPVTNPKGWELIAIGELTTKIRSGLSRRLSNEDIGVPVIRSTNMINGRLDISDIKYWYTDDPQGADVPSYFLKDGDVLVNFINSYDHIGKACIYEDIGRDCIYTTNIFVIHLNERCNTIWFNEYAKTQAYKFRLDKIIQPAVNQSSFTTADYRKKQIALPPIKLQNQFASFVQQVEAQKALLQESLTKLELNYKSLMQKCFRGEIF